MRAINTIDHYIFKELLGPFVISLFFLTFVFLMTRIPEITNMVMNYNADLSAIVLMVGYTLPRFMEFTIPMSIMISILLTFMRMSGENEIMALKGAGISLYRLFPPVVCFCLMGTVLCLWVTLFGITWGRLAIKEKTIEMARTSIDAALQERQFNTQIEDVMIYVSQVDMKTKQLKDVFIEDRRTSGVTSISLAPSGRLIQAGKTPVYTIRLENGTINQVNIDENSVSTIRFGEYDINLNLDTLGGEKKQISRELDEISAIELLRYIKAGRGGPKEINIAWMEFHEKFSIPAACLSLGLLAFPLGLQAASLRKSSGFSLGIFYFLLYYGLLAVGWSAGETGSYPPVIGMWLPNIVIGCIGVFFLVRNANENPVPMPAVASRVVSAVRAGLKRIK